ncbi:MAG: sugar phosphate isomerase/epimerase [Oscillospiraceae bacterium]|nr:sugar phosphate isomerase/epimerase [Oscillospiraceae bacterium]
MTPGLSTACLYPLYTEKVFLTYAKQGVKAVEVFANCKEEISPSYINDLRTTADFYGVKILSLHPYTCPMEPMFFFTEYKKRFAEGMEVYKKYYEAANTLGANAVVFHGGDFGYGISFDEYFERFGRLLDDSIKHGSMLCHENVERCKSRHSGFFQAMAKALPKSEFIFDIKQARRAGEDVNEFMKSMAGKIRHVHFSDHDDLSSCLAPGKGTFNIPKFLKTIRDDGFCGGVIVELYGENTSGIVELLDSYKHLCIHISTALKSDETNDTIRQTRA